ncbi:MAG: hypothetical protein BWX54_01971 [Verrucomicrobia bacterium ADurb.Bin018]|nr:MAG: hypothetical protein BWX54_01971 [Verrucomicrobia bacterium ADurb.Bin018]
MIRSLTLAHDPDTTMTTAQFWTRWRKMRATWPTLTPVQQKRWAELRADIEGMASTLHWLKAFCDELAQPEPVQEMQQLTMEETK